MASVRNTTSVETTFKNIIGDSGFLGKGSFGEVYGPFSWNGIECAIKRRVYNQRELMEQMQKEGEACAKWKSLNHTNLIKVYDAACDPNFNPPAMYIVMEFARGGSVEDALTKLTSPLPMEVVKDWAQQVANGMAHLHSNLVVHRDLKSANIVILEDFDPNQLDRKTLKITDFDCIKSHDHTVAMSFKGTIAWMAPEVRARATFSKASDVWSYGVLLWTMLTRKEAKELQFDIPETAPDVFKYLMKDCLDKDTTKRPTFGLIIEWLKKPDICVSVVGANNKTEIVNIPADSSVDQLLAVVSDVFGQKNNAAEIRLGFEDRSLEHGSGLTLWKAGIKKYSNLVVIARQNGGINEELQILLTRHSYASNKIANIHNSCLYL